MSDSLYHPDDPRLTAHVLGELTDEQRADVEALLASSPQARRALDELRDTSAQLFEALQSEPAAALTDEQRASIRAAAAKASAHQSAVASPKVRPVRRRTEPPRKRAGVVAVLAAVTVSAALSVVLNVPFATRPSLHDRAVSVVEGRQNLLALNLESENQVPLDRLGWQRGPAPTAESLSYRESESEATNMAGDANGVIEAEPGARFAIALPQTSISGGGIGGGMGSSAPASGPVVVQDFDSPQTAQSAPIGLVDPSNGAKGTEESAPSAGTVLTRSLQEHPPAGSPTNRQLSRWSYSGDAAAGPQMGSPQSFIVETPVIASNETDPRTFGWPTTFNGLAVSNGAVPHFGVTNNGEAFELGIPRFQSENVMSNSITPRQEMLYESLRLRGLTRRYRDNLRARLAFGVEQYAPIIENPFISPTEQPLSTFGLDVDTASYANVRRFLVDEQRWPPADAVRLEEMVNSFIYDDPEPRDEHPLAVTLEAAACPWDGSHRLVRIGVKGREIDRTDRPPTSLVFLIDTSGSMRDDNKLPLVKESLRLLAGEMTENDRIALVTYSTDAGLLLDSTSGEHREAIMTVIDSLEASGSTNGEAGLKVAYDVATRHFIENGSNRVILCTDGDFNVGESADAPLVRMISEKRDTGVFLSICGFGTGNLKDAKLEQIADHGNGQYHYIDGIREARKVFLEEFSGMLYTIAKDVKLQVEFNPAHVGAYRLLGYENRALAAQDFNNDRIDAGDLGAGHSVTALYEIVPPGGEVAKPATETPGVDPLKYQESGVGSRDSEDSRLAAPQREARPAGDDPQPSTLNPQPSRELLTVKLRYKPALPAGSRLNDGNTDESIKLDFPLVDNADNASPSDDLEWAAAVASFGMILRNSSYRGQSSIEGVLELARGAKGDDPTGARQEFIELVLEARRLHRRETGTPTPKPLQLSSLEAREKATVGGRYRELLDKFDRPEDFEIFGDFHDAGHKNASPDGKHPAGYWVYVYPHWYIWKETTAVSEADPF